MAEYDLIIIGGGPAGLTAGLYAARARLKTLLIESFAVPSQAVAADRIENYPGIPSGISGIELIDRFKRQAKAFGLEFDVGNVVDIKPQNGKDFRQWQIIAEDKVYDSLSIILAVGTRPRELEVAGESKLRGRGVSYCATCDGPLFKDRDIVIIGGGDTAVEEALFLTRFCRKVTMIHRRDRLRATKILQERALAHERLEFVWDSQVIEILGEENVEAVKIKDIKTQEESKIPCEGVFIFVGFIPNTDFLKPHKTSGFSQDKGIIELDEAGYVITDDNMKTSQEGVFACGDCRKKLLRQVVTACGDGANAAFSAQGYVEKLKKMSRMY
ncbi:MAG: thioredoxin-disulfide reductase [bacterium]|nr:thioredoxin-disulfide reductase [bacterium]